MKVRYPLALRAFDFFAARTPPAIKPLDFDLDAEDADFLRPPPINSPLDLCLLAPFELRESRDLPLDSR